VTHALAQPLTSAKGCVIKKHMTTPPSVSVTLVSQLPFKTHLYKAKKALWCVFSPPSRGRRRRRRTAAAIKRSGRLDIFFFRTPPQHASEKRGALPGLGGLIEVNAGAWRALWTRSRRSSLINSRTAQTPTPRMSHQLPPNPGGRSMAFKTSLPLLLLFQVSDTLRTEQNCCTMYFSFL